jgi:hypothetical protein
MPEPKKRAPRKAAPKAAPKAEEESQPQCPVRIGDRALVMVDVFELDGVMYRAPKSPSAALVLTYLRGVRGAHQLKKAAARNAALAEATEAYVIGILGADAWTALGESPLVTIEDVAAVVKKVSEDIGLPAVETFTGAQGNS